MMGLPVGGSRRAACSASNSPCTLPTRVSSSPTTSLPRILPGGSSSPSNATHPRPFQLPPTPAPTTPSPILDVEKYPQRRLRALVVSPSTWCWTHRWTSWTKETMHLSSSSASVFIGCGVVADGVEVEAGEREAESYSIARADKTSLARVAVTFLCGAFNKFCVAVVCLLALAPLGKTWLGIRGAETAATYIKFLIANTTPITNPSIVLSSNPNPSI